jgi:protein-tyrosine kinase
VSVVERALGKLRQGPPVVEGRATPIPSREGPVGSVVGPNEQIATESGRRVEIDRAALRATGYLPDEDQDRRFADEYRHIKRPLLVTAFSGEDRTGQPSPRLIMMASALPGDGKTFTSINLALSLARERDTSVVLIDADAAKPHISEIFGVNEELGLLDALADSSINVASLVLPTDVKGLSILPAGRMREGATELLASGRMSEVARQVLARDPRCVALFDSSPLVLTSESRTLAPWMGQIVLVVRAGYTPRQALLEALDVLPEGQKVSLVLTQGRQGLLQGGGYNGHSYGSYGEGRNAS